NDIDGLVLAAPVDASLGIPGSVVNSNVGKMYNEGYEFAASFKAINNQNFSWDVSANLTLADNNVTTLPSGDIIGGSYQTDVNIAPNIIIREGESVNSLYGFQYWGVNRANGNPVYYKADGSLVQGNLPGSTYSVFDPNNPAAAGATATLT